METSATSTCDSCEPKLMPSSLRQDPKTSKSTELNSSSQSNSPPTITASSTTETPMWSSSSMTRPGTSTTGTESTAQV